MPRRKRIPSYWLHKPTGQARVRINGRDHYLGKFGSAESRAAYARLIAEHYGDAAEARSVTPSSVDDPYPHVSIDELLLAYLDYAEGYYVEDGEPTKELECMQEAMGHLRAVYSDLPARQFGPLKLKAVRQHMVDACDLSRGVVNRRINRIKRIFKWAVAEELIPASVHESLRSVTGLKRGKTTARETEPVKPVPDAWVDAILPHVAPQVAAMIELQRLTGMRPEEVTLMRPCDIDMTAAVWVYEPYRHKNKWRDHRRLVPLGPQAQAIVRPYLDRRTDAFLFSPVEAEEWRNQQRRQKRQSPMTPSQANRKPKSKPKRPKRERYDTASYRRAITYGIKKANRRRAQQEGEAVTVPHWHPNQLRHAYATKVRRRFGVEAAQVGLGHARTNVVEIYAQKNLGLAIEVAQKMG